MDIVFDGRSDETESKLKSNDIKVSMISKSEMDEIRAIPPDKYMRVKQETWLETDGKTPVLSTGAGPCLIVFAVNTENGHVITGHFPEYNKDKQDRFTRRDLKYTQERFGQEEKPEGILIPNAEQIDILSYTRVDKGYEEFLNMKKRLKEWGIDKTEIYLFGNNNGAFGQNEEEFNARVTNSVLEQQSVSIDLYNLGIPFKKQHDYRVPGQDNVDDTYYSPEGRVIKHSIRVHRESEKKWLKNKN